MSVVEQLVRLESMKMEIPIKTEVSITVKKKVFVGAGDFVNVEDALVEVEQRGILKWE